MGRGGRQGIKTNLEMKNIKLANKDIKRYNYITYAQKGTGRMLRHGRY